MPQFFWWRYFFGFDLAFGIAAVLGRPNWYSCSRCEYRQESTKAGKFYTKVWMLKGASDNWSYFMAAYMPICALIVIGIVILTILSYCL
jgi:hypothetical protein